MFEARKHEQVEIQDRKSARYKLAQLLTEERFSEAMRLAKQWHGTGLIRTEDRTFVEDIIRLALEIQ